MRRSSIVKLTLLPVLASAAMAHADPGAPPPTMQPSPMPSEYDTPDPGGLTYQGPPGMAPEPVIMPPGMTPVMPEPVPCDVDPDQPRCEEVVVEPRYYGVWRGGFGGYFHAGVSGSSGHSGSGSVGG